MLITFDLNRVSNELIFFKIVNYFNPERKRFFTRDQAAWITEYKQTMFGTGEGNTHTVWNLQETDIIKVVWANQWQNYHLILFTLVVINICYFNKSHSLLVKWIFLNQFLDLKELASIKC